MTYALPDHLSYCLSDGMFVFLDTYADRYFALDVSTAETFRKLHEGSDISSQDAEDLLRLNLITLKGERRVRPPDFRPAAVSVLEAETRPRLKHPLDILSVCLALRLVSHRMSRRGLNHALERFRASNTHISLRPALTRGWSPRDYMSAVRRYHAARKYVPGDIICLRDSLALGQFLQWLNMPSTLILAVIAKPFAAHAWLQWRDMVLNDSVGYVRHHTPIYVQ